MQAVLSVFRETIPRWRQQHRSKQYDNNLESFYSEFQLPILVAVLYFLFQLPVIQKYIYKIIPGLFNADGNPNLFGYVFNSITFGLVYLFLLKMMKYFSNV